MMLHTKYQGSMACGFRHEEFYTFSLCKTFEPPGDAIFGPRGLILPNLAVVHLVMIHTRYQGSKPCGFEQDEFFTFSLYKPM